MSRLSLKLLLLLCVLAASLAGALRAQQPARPAPSAPADAVPAPSQLRAFRLIARQLVEPPGSGVSYSYAGPEQERVTVFVYPVPDDVRVGSDPQEWTTSEGRKYPETFPLGLQRGWYEAIRLASAEPAPQQVDSVSVPGFAVAAAAVKGSDTNIELEMLYLVSNAFVKIRATVPIGRYRRSQVRGFAADLVALFVRRGLPN